LYALAKYLKIEKAYVFAHDKGTGHAAAFAALHSPLVARLGLSEYPLPGYGYETFWAPSYDWDLYSNWQLAFFSVPDAATFFISGKEEQMLNWYFYHSSYSGPEAFSQDTIAKYTSSISKPGFLRAMFKPFEAKVIGEDAAFFKSTVGKNPFEMPVLVLGGEASLAPKSAIEQLYGPVTKDLTADIVPKAGHWIGELLCRKSVVDALKLKEFLLMSF
jgi:pimeloyl-ACP methyl ester carboxylesterase